MTTSPGTRTLDILRQLPDLVAESERVADRLVAEPVPSDDLAPGAPVPPASDAWGSGLDAATSGTPPRGTILRGDNLPILARLAARGWHADLIAIDPPYCSGRTYRREENDTGAGGFGFGDVWDDGIAGYLQMLAPRLVLMRRVLASTGSIYVHVDWHAAHWVRLLLDTIFGPECFCNEIAWLYGLGGSTPRRWPRKHDTILWYAREAGRQWFEADMVPATSQRMKGRLKKAPDYWDIPALNNRAAERTGYPTQKPQALAERIVRSSCPPGGLVADFFAGSGTIGAAARELGRRWLLVDSSREAVDLMRHRLG